ncbi:MAG: archaeosine biosynthesis radical SAM protein RaSEA [Methanolinea sp.]|jgi:hypothetical protein|nr:archaeosine biosynthesis radical SAM protein RaSEA [Methanolinea sp.]
MITHVNQREVSERPLAAWTGCDRVLGEVVSTLTLILKTGGCEWNRCRMCSYRHERYGTSDSRELETLLLSQVSWVKDNFPLGAIDVVKIYTSGSFFDSHEVPPAARDALAGMLKGKRVIAETRPEFVSGDALSSFMSTIDDNSHDTPLYVAIGVETSNDAIREKCINKGFSWDDFCQAAHVARTAGAGVKAYLLVKPLFLTEAEALGDMITSIHDLSGLADMISLNPCTVQRGTELEYYWKKREYRPPYLWSVLSILMMSPVHLTCDPLGGGQPRGAHNCGTCDHQIVKGIRDYSLSGDRELLRALYNTPCACREEWEYVLQRERPYCMPLTH